MKKTLILSMLLASSGVFAEEVNPFMSAQDREEALKKERKSEEDKLKKMVTEALEEIKKAQGSSDNPEDSKVRPDSFGQNRSAAPSDQKMDKPVPEDPSDFAIVGMNEKHVLIRQMDNKSMIVGVGRKFWDKGEAYETAIVEHETVKITRVSDGKVVFYGGVGSVFTPGEASASSSRNERGSGAFGNES